MFRVVNQFKRLYNDDGRDDKTFVVEQRLLERAQTRLRMAAEELMNKSQILYDLVVADAPPKHHIH
jgi:hypothetical protein